VNAKKVLDEIKWRGDKTMDKVTICYLHRGAPGDIKSVKGSLVKLGQSFFTIEGDLEGGKIPYHRIRRIDYGGEAVFRRHATLAIKGRVFSGATSPDSSGRYYTSMEGYRRQFRSLLGFDPFPGTLNVKVDRKDKNLQTLRQSEGIVIHPFEMGSRSFGGGKCFRARIKGHECAVIMPDVTCHRDAIEILSPLHLRGAFGFKDGDRVRVDVFY